METILTVETPETPSIAVFVPIEDGHAGVDPNEDPNFGNAVKVAARIRELAPQYHQKDRESKFAAEDAKRIREELSVEFAVYKAIHVGKGRDGNWGPFITELGFAVRTVDRWVDKKLASGELPEWVATRLKANKDPEPEPEPETQEERPYTLLLHFSDTQKKAFAEAADKFHDDTLAEVIFQAVTTHPIALVLKKRMTFLDDETEVCAEPPTIVEKMEHEAAVGVSA